MFSIRRFFSRDEHQERGARPDFRHRPLVETDIDAVMRIEEP